ncbi:LysR family transcriptional regulator [Burkholderia anthina]|uniref:LysR family transcriptional regulator n=1 Tax=Burkholderia anthina TaxID=179879 RepID=UPI0009BDEDC8|nr:LysR family transcriptional regulator [Burkholderia anthina]
MDFFASMQVFVRIVETGSFSRTAELLNMPKPSISRMLQILETKLGTRLINRTTRRISITEDGQYFYANSVRLLNELQNVREELGDSRRTARGRVRVNLPTVMATNIVAPALPDFFSSHPDVEVDLGLTDRAVNIVGEGVDCVVRVGPIDDSDFVARRIGSFVDLTCASPGYLEKYGEPHTLQDLAAHFAVNYVSSRTGRIRPWEFCRNGSIETVTMKSKVSVDDADAYLSCGLAGIGILKESSFSMMPHIETGALRRILTDYTSPTRPVSILYAPNRNLPKRVRVFIDWIADLYAQHPSMQVEQ